MKRLENLLFAGLIAATLCASSGLAADKDPASGEKAGLRVRLVLVDGGEYDARGPVTHKDGLILFYGDDGRLSSIRESQVREVLHLDDQPAARPTAVPAKTSPVTPSLSVDRPGTTEYSNADLAPAVADDVGLPDPNDLPAEAFTNEDLPEAPESASTVTSDDEAGDEEMESDETAAADDVQAGEPGGLAVDEEQWRTVLTDADAGILETEGEVTTIRRLLDCVQRGLPLDSEGCRPAINRQMKNESFFKSPTEKSLRKRLAETQERLEELRADRRRILEDAREAGVELE